VAANLELAPPPVVVDGLLAVPIDMTAIAGTIVFDAAAQTAVADITVTFNAGIADGHAVFDLRQTITAAWLDGVSIPVAQLASHDFGGGANAGQRILESLLLAGSAHTLRLTYALGSPQASTAGSYQPALTWAAGPRLAWNFGFTDLGGGRYLEAWIPANLTYDQFSLDLDIEIRNTVIAHSVISNATIAVVAANHWQLSWPSSITALSTLLEIRATDTITSQTDTVALPISGTSVTLEAWKFAGSAINLTTELTNMHNALFANEASAGEYLHGNRFVAMLRDDSSGMEYDGGTTTSLGALRHELFHSWWGRGLKPALPRDGWWDEAWTVYQMAGGTGAVPLDFLDSAVTLSARNPWVRATPGGAYTRGRELFDGVASLVGVTNASQWMNEFYAANSAAPVNTEALEQYLLARSGADTLVDAFHRFVYGFADPAATPDLWLKDDPAHTGANFWPGTFWDSPDLWIRNGPDGGLDHQNPAAGQDNWFHARVRNRSATQRIEHFAVSFNVKSFAGTQFSYPGDFLPAVAAATGFDLAPGAERIVTQRWPSASVPAAGVHTCLLAAAICRGEHPAAGAHVWENNNLAQKNLTVVELAPDEWFVLPFVIRNDVWRWPWFVLTVAREPRFERAAVELLHAAGPELLRWRAGKSWRGRLESDARLKSAAPPFDCGGGHAEHKSGSWTSRNPDSFWKQRIGERVAGQFSTGRVSNLPITLPDRDPLRVGLRIHAPRDAKPGERFRVHLIKRSPLLRRALGGVAVEVRIR